MSYVDCLHDSDKDVIHVVERVDGKRIYKEYPTNYVFYYEDPKGKFLSVYGDPLRQFSCRKRTEFQKELRMHSRKKIFESDINPIFRMLSDNYLGQEGPKLNTVFFDIETDLIQRKVSLPLPTHLIQ